MQQLTRILFLMAALAACQASAQDVVRVGNLKFAHYGAIAYMKEIAPRFNLKIEERMFAKGVDILPAIVAGEIDAAASAADAAIAGRASGVPIFAVAGFAKGGARLVAAPEAQVKSVADLRGKRVGVTRGGAQELLLLAELSAAGLTWADKPGKDVLIVYLAFADLNQALLARNIDAMMQSEPQSSQAINKKFGVEVLKPYGTPMGEPIRTLVVTEKLYKERRDVALRFIKCFLEATRTFIEQPAVAEKYVRENLFKHQLSSEDYRDAIGNSPFTWHLDIAHIDITTELMQKYGVGRMSTPPRAAEWVKLDLLTQAKTELRLP